MGEGAKHTHPSRGLELSERHHERLVERSVYEDVPGCSDFSGGCHEGRRHEKDDEPARGGQDTEGPQYDRIEQNGETVYQAQEFDPWFEQARLFIEAVRSGDGSAILNDYHDGLYSLAPVLAGGESSKRHGECIDVPAFMKA